MDGGELRLEQTDAIITDAVIVKTEAGPVITFRPQIWF